MCCIGILKQRRTSAFKNWFLEKAKEKQSESSVIVACDMTIHIRAWIKKGFAETAQVFLRGNTRPYYIKECSC